MSGHSLLCHDDTEANVTSILIMLETQRKWYEPAFGMLGWHIGFWNLVGAVGFTVRVSPISDV